MRSTETPTSAPRRIHPLTGIALGLVMIVIGLYRIATENVGVYNIPSTWSHFVLGFALFVAGAVVAAMNVRRACKPDHPDEPSAATLPDDFKDEIFGTAADLPAGPASAASANWDEAVIIGPWSDSYH